MNLISTLQNQIDMANLRIILARIFVLLVCLPVHEYAHALTAYKLGDDTGKRKGRMSLNPFRHLDFAGSCLILLMGFGYAKPVPVNPSNFRNRKRDMAVTAFAGPFSNFLMSVLFLFAVNILNRITRQTGTGSVLTSFLLQSAYINISLAVFNLLPIPPLDGSKVFGAFLPKEFAGLGNRRTLSLFFILILVSGRMGFSPIGYLSGSIFRFLYRLIVW